MSDREVALEQEIATLRTVMGTLREAVADLRESAIRWKALYEITLGRCAELEAELPKLKRPDEAAN